MNPRRGQRRGERPRRAGGKRSGCPRLKEALGGYLYEADDLDAAIELASKITAARMGGSVEAPTQGAVTLEDAFRDERRRVLATLIGFLGDFDLAEEAAEIAVGGLQDFDDDESAHTGANNSF